MMIIGQYLLMKEAKIEIQSLASGNYGDNYAKGIVLANDELLWDDTKYDPDSIASTTHAQGVALMDDFGFISKRDTEVRKGVIDTQINLLGRRNYDDNENDYEDYNNSTHMYYSFINRNVPIVNSTADYNDFFYYNAKPTVDIFINNLKVM